MSIPDAYKATRIRPEDIDAKREKLTEQIRVLQNTFMACQEHNGDWAHFCIRVKKEKVASLPQQYPPLIIFQQRTLYCLSTARKSLGFLASITGDFAYAVIHSLQARPNETTHTNGAKVVLSAFNAFSAVDQLQPDAKMRSLALTCVPKTTDKMLDLLIHGFRDIATASIPVNPDPSSMPLRTGWETPDRARAQMRSLQAHFNRNLPFYVQPSVGDFETCRRNQHVLSNTHLMLSHSLLSFGDHLTVGAYMILQGAAVGTSYKKKGSEMIQHTECRRAQMFQESAASDVPALLHVAQNALWGEKSLLPPFS